MMRKEKREDQSVGVALRCLRAGVADSYGCAVFGDVIGPYGRKSCKPMRLLD